MRYFETRKARIEIIPMIDIMLFLLVFFLIVTLHMIPDSGVGAHLPHSASSRSMPHPDRVVSLAADGTISLDGKKLAPAQLTARLRRNHPKQLRVTIAGAGKASLQSLLDVMDACRKAGVTHLGIAARHSAAPGNGG